jgi:hypothetical protein
MQVLTCLLINKSVHPLELAKCQPGIGRDAAIESAQVGQRKGRERLLFVNKKQQKTF